MKKNKISKNWLRRQNKDIYVKQSKSEGYRSRAVYKLKDIDDKFKLFHNNISVIDLGAAPGSWSQYVSRKVKNGKIMSIDLKKIENIDRTHHVVGDFTDSKIKKKIRDFFKSKVDIVLSDMAPNTTGNKNIDSLVTGELCLDAMSFTKEILNYEGHFVSKIFMGSVFNEIISEAKKNFKIVKVFKPLASRKDSKENFIICKYLK